MITRDQADQLLRELYSARSTGQLDRLCACFCADATFRISGATDGKPIAVTSAGIDEIRIWLATLVKAFRITDQKMISIIIDGERAAVHWRANINSRITGAMVPTELVDLIEFRTGRIGAYVEFFMPASP